MLASASLAVAGLQGACLPVAQSKSFLPIIYQILSYMPASQSQPSIVATEASTSSSSTSFDLGATITQHCARMQHHQITDMLTMRSMPYTMGPSGFASYATANTSKEQSRHTTEPTSEAVTAGDTRQRQHASSKQKEPAHFSQSDMAKLLNAMIQPLPLGQSRNYSIDDVAVKMNGMLFLDPSRTLQSTMRALYVLKKVLSDDAHVYIVNSNPLLAPLMKGAARCCTNPNVWFLTEPFKRGTLTKNKGAGLFRPAHQPVREILAQRGLVMKNVHCPTPHALQGPRPTLELLDQWRLYGKRRALRGGVGAKAYNVLKALVEQEAQSAELPLPNALLGDLARLRLMIVLDATHDMEAIEEAYQTNVLTASVVNAHSDLSRITYPIYAGEYHVAYQHFILDWILKIANLPPPEAAA